MVKPLSAMDKPLVNAFLYKFGRFYINKNITNAKLSKFLQIDNKKKLQNDTKLRWSRVRMAFGKGLSIGQCTLPIDGIIIIKKGQQCKAGREWYTPYQSKDPSPTIPTYSQYKVQ